jgi:MYXO-CTERM domain-containing protein
VPEPSADALALAGVGVLGFWGRRQKTQKRTAEAAAA